jgi:hypothetical protein
VSFIMPNEHCWSLFEKLRERPEIAARPPSLHPQRRLTGSHGVYVTMKARVAVSERLLQYQGWELKTWGHSDVDPSTTDPFYGSVVVKRLNSAYSEVAASIWKRRVDLLGLLEKVAIECGLSTRPGVKFPQHPGSEVCSLVEDPRNSGKARFFDFP